MSRKKRKKVLHIGNIANNAYQNAKMLNKIGYDCDVLSYDYYHIMACPEWDEAEVSGEIGNPNFPAWNKVNLHGYKRPNWFVSGPLYMCVRYLMARRDEKKVRAFIYWKCLQWIRNDIVKTQDANMYTLAKIIALKSALQLFPIKIYQNVLPILVKIYQNIMSLLIRGYQKVPSREMKKIIKKYCETLLCLRDKKDIINHDNLSANNRIDKTYNMVINDFKNLFPERECKFNKDIVCSYIIMAEAMKPLLKQYDIVVGYATNPIFLYLSGIENYVAYEHGTIRDMPYENNDMGRLLLLSYARAKVVYVTNVDCYDSAKYIVKSTNTPIVCGLHGLDINRVINKIENNIVGQEFDPRFGVASDIPLFFCPSRHDFDTVRQTFMKAEDKMLLAAERLINDFPEFIIILVNWGNDVKAIKKIIHEHNLEKNVMWIAPLNKNQLYKVYQHVDAVLDQFYWKAYGAITFEVLAVQNCALIASDVRQDYQKKFFGDILPYFACNDVEDIYKAMKATIQKDEKYKKYTSISREWIRLHHSNKRIIRKLEEAFKYCEGK